MIKKIRIELLIFLLLLISIFFSYKIDSVFYNYFSKTNYSDRAEYLRGFFVGITELGDSLWYFLIFFIIFIVSYLAKITKLISLKNYSYLKKISIFSFLYLFLVGLITQVIKHLIGRARPNHTNFSEGFDFYFLTTDSTLHSFPSGHSSTIIGVVLIASLVLPKLRIVFYLFGFIVAFSRVVVGAHFITDVFAGTLLAIIVYKILEHLIRKKYSETYMSKLEIHNTSLLLKILIFFFLIGVLVTFGPEFDIYLSSFFYFGNNQFMLQNYYSLSIFFRKILLPLLLIYIFIFPILGKFMPLQRLFFGYKFSIKEIVFIWICGLGTLMVVINILLKDMWGRVRPNDILHFDGVGFFTPWFKFGGSCTSNCSFVSGDASVGFMLVIFYFIIQKNIYCYLALFFGLIFGFIRIIAGGHFFSDVIFSQIIVTVSVSMFFILYKRLYEK